MEKPRCTFRKKFLNCDMKAYNRLRMAIRCNDKVLVQQLVDDGVNVNGVYEGGYKEVDPDMDPYCGYIPANHPIFTPLHLAVMSRNADIVKILLDKGADMNARIWSGETPLTLAAKTQNTIIIDLLLGHDSVHNLWDYNGFTHLHIACMRNNTNVVRKLLLLDRQRKINEAIEESHVDWVGYTPLHFAVHFEGEETVELLLKCGAKITLDDGNYRSPLHLAHLHRNEKIIDLLLEAHKYVFQNPTTEEGLSHFHIACTRNNTSVVEHFLKMGVNVDDEVRNSQWEGWRAIHFAMLYECIDVIKLLLRCEIRLEAQCFSELLECAYIMENESYYNLFSSRAIDSDIRDMEYQKQSMFYNACIKNETGKIKELLNGDVASFKCDLEKPICYGLTPLHLAANQGSTSVINFLVANGANILAQDAKGRTPLHIAFESSWDRCGEIANHFAAVTQNVADNKGLSIFHILCALGCMKAVQNLLQSGVDVNSQVGTESALYAGFTPLHFAINSVKPQVVDILLEHGANIIHPDRSNLNCFEFVADRISMSDNYDFDDMKKNFTILMKILLHASNNHFQLNRRGLSLLHGLSTFENSDKISQLEQYLVKHRDEINETIEFPFWHKYSALHVATICFRRFDLTDLLLENGANFSDINGVGNTIIEGTFLFGVPDEKSYDEVQQLFILAAKYQAFDSSAFHLACGLGLTFLVKCVLGTIAGDLELKVEWLNFTNDLGQTPLHSLLLLSNFSRKKMAALLLEHDANVDAKDFQLQSPLHYAQLAIEPSITKLLIQYGADVNAQNIFGETPLHKLLYRIQNQDNISHSSVETAHVCDQINLLLNEGFDINIADRRGSTCLMIIRRFEDDLEIQVTSILMEHVVKLQLIRFFISEDNRQAYSRLSRSVELSDRTIHELAEKCEYELAAMQCEYIDRYSTLFSIIYKSLSSIAVYCKNVTLCNIIRAAEFTQKYPLCGCLIKLQIRKGRTIKPVLNKCMKSFRTLLGPSLPDQCINSILDHLSTSDLGNIIKSCE
ncbi:hypothetical protein QAD02_011307 [Eretmocerus hayati]|uniref:Uncharacterized protein n=1 Tax=Eretmocerus hayati TaxID=131215 RepID=A0ACC2NY40_9HYME|nr:hypothetical protein QAD02_011307 [Eretmocerus hayati]